MSRSLLSALVCAALVSSACSAGSTQPDPSTETPARSGPRTAVDACTLVQKRDVENALGKELRVVGRRVEAPTLATETCLWGRDFSVADLEVQVTPGPVAEDTFRQAFGPDAGGEPQQVDDLGDAAYTRSGLTDRTLQVLSDGVVITLEATDDPGRPLRDAALREVGSAAVDALPANPELPAGAPGRPCAQIDDALVAEVVGQRPRLRRAHRGRRGAVMCSWSALPGNLVVTVRSEPTQVRNFRANLSPRVYTSVAGVRAEAYSQKQRAGDLLMFVGDVLVEVDALPDQGFDSADAASSEAELRLARRLVQLFG